MALLLSNQIKVKVDIRKWSECQRPWYET